MNLSNDNIIHTKGKHIEYIQFRKLLEYKDILSHAYSIGKNVNFRTAKADRDNISESDFNYAIDSYKKLCDELDLNYINVVKANQTHTDNIKIVESKINKDFLDINTECYNNTDGLITCKSDLILSTTNADCILLLLFDPKTRTIANVHSGWRGTLQKISTKTVKKMKLEFGCNPKDIICCIAPSIRKCHFEVDGDVKNMFQKEFKELSQENIIQKQKDAHKWNIDTVLINQIILIKEGILKENIIDCGICSVCNSELIHSYRVEKNEYGLETAIISLK